MQTDRAAQIAALSLPLDQLPDPLPIPTIEQPFDVTIRPPGSKSITNRALLLAALADGVSELHGPLIDADDAQVMLRAIQQLGAKVEIIRAVNNKRGGTGGFSASGVANLDIMRINGVAGRWKIPAGQTINLNLNNAGTATRFLTAAAILAPPDSNGIIIDGDARMRQRPISELADALEQLGIRIEYLGSTGHPPLRIVPPIDHRSLNDLISFGRTASSQFISAMLMACPFLDRDVGIVCTEPPTSEPYVRMTQDVMEAVGIAFLRKTLQNKSDLPGMRSRLPGQRLPAFSYNIEPDASGATYFLACAALVPNARCIIDGLPWIGEPGTSLQGDAWFGGLIAAMGADERADEHSTEASGNATLAAIDYSLADMPDTAMTAAVLACFASPTTDNPAAASTLRGLRTLRVKETDRLAALQTELTKFGATVDIFEETLGGQQDEGLRITPPPLPTTHSPLPPIFFDTYHDHRMAMSLALIGLRRPNVFIRDPKCVAKTYPTFWKDLAKLYQ